MKLDCSVKDSIHYYLSSFISPVEVDFLIGEHERLFGKPFNLDDVTQTNLYKSLNNIFHNPAITLKYYLKEYLDIMFDLDDGNSNFSELEQSVINSLSEKYKSITAVSERTNSIIDQIPNAEYLPNPVGYNCYDYDDKSRAYGEQMKTVKQFEYLRTSGLFSFTDINELEDLLVKGFRNTLNALINNTKAPSFVSIDVRSKFIKLQQLANGDLDTLLSSVKKAELTFNDIFDAVLNNIQLQFLDSKGVDLDEANQKLLSNVMILSRFREQFLLTAQPKLQSQLKLRVPIMFHVETLADQLGDLVESTDKNFDDDDLTSEYEGNTITDGNDNRLADGDNTVVSRDNYNIDILTINLQKSMSRELSMKLADIVNTNMPVDEYGFTNYYDQTQVYRTLMKECYACTSSYELYQLLNSDRFNAPFKNQLLLLVNHNNRFLTQLFNAIHTSFNSYLRITQDATTDTFDISEANRVTGNDVMWNMLQSAVSESNKLLLIKKDALKDDARVIKNTTVASMYVNLCNNLKTIVPLVNANNVPENLEYFYFEVGREGNKAGRKVLMHRTSNGRIIQAGYPAVETLYNIKTIGQIVAENPTQENQSKLALFQSNVYGIDFSKYTINQFFNKLFADLGLDGLLEGDNNISKDFIEYPNSHYNPETGEREFYYTNHIDSLASKIATILDKETFSTDKKLLKGLMFRVNASYNNDYDFSSISDGKSYQTHTLCSQLQHIMYELQKTTVDELDQLRKTITGSQTDPIENRNCEIWEGEFFNEPWYQSWKKNLLTKFGPIGEDGTRQTQLQMGSMNLKTFLSRNKKSWSDLDMRDFLLAEFAAFHFKYADKKQHYYALPQMEDKGTAYFMSNEALASNIDQTSGFSKLSYAEASIFMQELSRIRRTYLQAVERNDNKAANKKFDCQLAESIVDGQFTLEPFIDFTKNLGGARFHYLGAMNKLISLINYTPEELRQNQSIWNLTDDELQLILQMRQYIYRSNDRTLVNSEDRAFNSLQDIVNVAARVLHQNARDQFEEDYDTLFEKDLWSYMLILYDYYSEHDSPLFVSDKFLQLMSDYFKASENHDTDAANNLRSQLMEDDSILSNVKDLMFHQQYNQQYATEQILSFFTGDLAQYVDLDTATKRLSQFVASGIIPDMNYDGQYDGTDNFKEKSILVIDDISGEFIDPQMQELLQNSFWEFYLNGRDREKLSEQEISAIETKVNKDLKAYQDTVLTDGQSIMSVAYVKEYLKAIGRLTPTQEQYLNLVIELYICEDSEFADKLKVYNKFVSENDFKELNTLKTHTLDIRAISINGTPVKETKAQQIKTAEMLCLDINQFVHNGKRDEGNLLYQLQRWMLKNTIDGLTTKSSMKVWSPTPATIDTRPDPKTGYKRSIKDIIDNLDANSASVIKVRLDRNILANESPSHYLDNKRQLGIQMQHLILQSIDLNATYTVPIKDGTIVHIKGDQLYQHVNELWESKYQLIYDRIVGKYDQIDDQNDVSPEIKHWKKQRYTQQLLLKSLVNAENFSYQTWYALQLDENGNFMMPIDTTSIYTVVQKLVFNLIKKQLVGAPVNGGYLVQTANICNFNKDEVQYDEHLKFEGIYEGNKLVGIKSLEVDMPLYNSKLIEKYMDPEKREIQIDKIPEELKSLICYRIPTEGYCSIFSIRVRRFTDPKAGGNIVLPPAITTISGSDFDIDKMFFMAPAIDKNGEYISPAGNSEGAIDNQLLAIYRTILAHKSTLAERFQPQGFSDVEDVDTLFKKINYYKNSKNQITEENVLDPEFPINSEFDLRNAGNPAVQASLHVRNSISKDAVGIFANPNTIHAILLHYPIYLNHDNADELKINGISLIGKDGFRFSSEYCADGNTKQASQIRQLLAAAVDDAKRPRFANLNINLCTADLLTALIQMGFTLRQAILIINQPIVLQQIDEYLKTEPERIDFPSYLAKHGADSTIRFDLSEEDLIKSILHDSADSEQQKVNILPLITKAAKVASDFKQLLPRFKCDNSGATSWNTVFDYVQYRVQKQAITDRINNGESEFQPSILKLWEVDEDGNPVEGSNAKLAKIEYLTDRCIDRMMEELGSKYTADKLTEIATLILNKTQGESLSVRNIRDIYNGLQAYIYTNEDNDETKSANSKYHPITDDVYYIGENQTAKKQLSVQKIGNFAQDLMDAKSYFKSVGKYQNLFGNRGLVRTHPFKQRSKKSARNFSVVNTYLFSEEHSFRNTMSTEWEQMFYDDTIIPTLGIKVSDLALELVNYFVLKNAFGVNNNSAILVLPSIILNKVKLQDKFLRLTNVFKHTISETEDLNNFAELYCRNNKSVVHPIWPYEKNTPRPETIAPNLDDNENFEDLPDFIKYGYCFYKKSYSDRQLVYKRLPWLGADEICKEYNSKYIDNPELTLVPGLNKLWLYDKKDKKEPDEFPVLLANLQNTIQSVQDVVNKQDNRDQLMSEISLLNLGLNTTSTKLIMSNLLNKPVVEISDLVVKSTTDINTIKKFIAGLKKYINEKGIC